MQTSICESGMHGSGDDFEYTSKKRSDSKRGDHYRRTEKSNGLSRSATPTKETSHVQRI